MACLFDLKTKQRCFLSAYHRFGRLPYAVDTVIKQAHISKHHATIEWLNDSWTIRDLSRNGTWLNHSRLTANIRHPLQLNDKISFDESADNDFNVSDLSPPGDLLIPVDTDSTVPAVRLDPYHLLPDEQNPEIVIYMDRALGQWCIERLVALNTAPITLNENDVVEFGGQSWQLKLGHVETVTRQVELPKQTLNGLDFIFDLSLDEEVTQLKLRTPEQTLDFHIRSHHYLTLNLARYRASDAGKGLDETQQGWVYPEQLTKDLGIDISYLNIQIHRARKQFADQLHNSYDAQHLIQRRAGRLRFGGSLFSVYKGQQLECELHDMSCGG